MVLSAVAPAVVGAAVPGRPAIHHHATCQFACVYVVALVEAGGLPCHGRRHFQGACLLWRVWEGTSENAPRPVEPAVRRAAVWSMTGTGGERCEAR